jgi:hyperosmotically inducible protein
MYMKRAFCLLFVLLFFISLSYGCKTTKNTGEAIKEGTTEAAEEVGEAAQSAGREIEDGSITAAIKMKFANDEVVSASNIDVDTNHGNVTLNGTVANQSEADRAVELAKSVAGVKTVRSNLVIGS